MHPSDKLLLKSFSVLVVLIIVGFVFPQFAMVLLVLACTLMFFGSQDSNLKSTCSSHKWVDHSSYLFSPSWKVIRYKVMERDGFRCKSCGDDSNLHVHHIHYKRLGAEKLEDLITVCAICHKELHDYHGKNAKYYPLLRSIQC